MEKTIQTIQSTIPTIPTIQTILILLNCLELVGEFVLLELVELVESLFELLFDLSSAKVQRTTNYQKNDMLWGPPRGSQKGAHSLGFLWVTKQLGCSPQAANSHHPTD